MVHWQIRRSQLFWKQLPRLSLTIKQFRYPNRLSSPLRLHFDENHSWRRSVVRLIDLQTDTLWWKKRAMSIACVLFICFLELLCVVSMHAHQFLCFVYGLFVYVRRYNYIIQCRSKNWINWSFKKGIYVVWYAYSMNCIENLFNVPSKRKKNKYIMFLISWVMISVSHLEHTMEPRS